MQKNDDVKKSTEQPKSDSGMGITGIVGLILGMVAVKVIWHLLS